MLRDVIEFNLETYHDNRGTFSNVVGLDFIANHGFDLSDASISQAANVESGTIRGLHYQVFPFKQAKVVWCSSGSAFDVVVDINPDSENFGEWQSFELNSNQSKAVLIPAGFAHGYQTLSNDTVISYLLLGETSFEHSRSIVWNDKKLSISWPQELTKISDKDKAADPWPPRS